MGPRDVDVIVTDDRMDGVEFMVRARDAVPEVPAVVVTAHPDAETRRRALPFGAFRLLTKAGDPEELARSLERALRRSAP